MARPPVRGERAYAAILRAYPPGFRKEYGPDLLQLFRDRALDRNGVWVWALRDVLASAPRMRWEENAMRTWAVGTLVCVAAIAIGAIVTGVDSPGGLAVVSFAVLPVVALIGLVPIMLGKRVARSSESIYGADGTRGFTWWLVPAAGLGALEIAGGVRKLLEQVKAENVFAMAIFTAFAVAVFTGLALRARGRNLGNALITFGVLGSTVVLWSIVPPILALVVIVAALVEIGATSHRVADGRSALEPNSNA